MPIRASVNAPLATTHGIYGHLDCSDLERAMQAFAAELDRRQREP